MVLSDIRMQVSWIGRNLGGGNLENHGALLSGLCKWDTQLEQLGDDGGEVLEEQCLILGVLLDPLFEGLIGH
jgi:hypothetical protein